MVSVTLILACIASIVVAAPGTNVVQIQQAGAAKLVTDLQTLDADTQKMTATTKNYQGGKLKALPIRNAETKLSADIERMNTDAQSLTTFTDEETNALLAQTKMNEASIKDVLDALVEKKDAFAASSLDGQIKTSIGRLSTVTKNLGDSLSEKSPQTLRSQVEQQSSQFQALFKDASGKYQ